MKWFSSMASISINQPTFHCAAHTNQNTTIILIRWRKINVIIKYTAVEQRKNKQKSEDQMK